MNYPFRFKNGRFGMVIRIHDDAENVQWNKNHAGVQVHDEEKIRWVPFENIIDWGGGALAEV